jgi:hypothetical protein
VKRRRFLSRLARRNWRSEPESENEERRDKREQRTFVVTILVAAMTGVAFQEMVSAVGEEFRSGVLAIGTLLLALVFFLTTIRFFVGAALHLTSPGLLWAPGFVWMYDLMFILFETFLLIALGSVSTLGRGGVGFIPILLLLLGTDIVWVLSQWILGKANRRFYRASIPWEWFWINGLVICAVLITQAVTPPYGTAGLATLAFINSVAFVVDLFTVDHYHLL